MLVLQIIFSIHDDVDRIGIISETANVFIIYNRRVDVRTERVYNVHEYTCLILKDIVFKTK